MSDTIDYEARRLITAISGDVCVLRESTSALSRRLDDHTRLNEAFESEVRSALRDILTKIDEGQAETVAKLNSLMVSALVGSLTLVVSLIAYIWITRVG